MYQKFVIGTLTTVNAMIGPIGPAPDPYQSLYRLDVGGHGACAAVQSKPGLLVMKIEKVADTYFKLLINGQACSTGPASQPIAMSYNLPSELLDAEFIDGLPTGASYVVHGLPSNEGERKKTSLKFVKREAVGDAVPVEIEWLPSADGRTEKKPVTIWVRKALRSGGLLWTKLHLTDLNTLVASLLHRDELPASIGIANEIRPGAQGPKRIR